MPKIRFRNFTNDLSREWMSELTFLATGQHTAVIDNQAERVDLEFTDPYGGESDHYKIPFIYQHNFPSLKEGLTDKESECQIRSSVLRSNRFVRP
jgi:hypothetical protein